MTNNRESKNRYVHEQVLEKCWHLPQLVEPENDWWKCQCGKTSTGFSKDFIFQNPDYCSDESPRSLLDNVISKMEGDALGTALAEQLDQLPAIEGTVLWWPTAEQIVDACIAAHKAVQTALDGSVSDQPYQPEDQ